MITQGNSKLMEHELQDQLQRLETEKQMLKKELTFQNEHVKELQEKLGSWIRKALDKKPRPEFIRESHDGGYHFKEIALNDIPGDISYREALRHVKNNILPKEYPYRYHNIYLSKHYGSWVVKLSKKDPVDMNYAPKDKQITANKLLIQLQWDLMEELRRWETIMMDTTLDAQNVDREKSNYLVAAINELFAKVQQTRFEGQS